MVLGFAFMAVTTSVGGQWRDLVYASPQGWACLAYLGVLSSGLGYLFWNAGVEEIGPSATSAFLYLEPLAALAAGRLLLGEVVSATAVLGGALILAGVYGVNAGRRLPAAPEEAG
jgi:drug/metabolite transporter (DMT)-like permease